MSHRTPKATIPLPEPQPLNGWWPRFDLHGHVACGASTIIVDTTTVFQPGWRPKWHTAGSSFVCQGAGDLLYQVAITTGESRALSAGPVSIYAAGAGAYHIANRAGGEITCEIDPHVGTVASVFEYNDSNNDRSIIVEGQTLYGHGPVDDVRIDKGFVVWRHYAQNTMGYLHGQVRSLSVTKHGWEGNPVPFWLGEEPWLLFQTNLDLRVRPVESEDGYVIATGEDQNFNPDVMVLNGRIAVVWNDSRGYRYSLTIDPASPRTRVADTNEGSVPVPVPPATTVAVRGLPQKTWVAPFFSHSEQYGDTPLDQHVGNAILVLGKEGDDDALRRNLDRVRPLNMPMIVGVAAAVDPVNLNQTMAWWTGRGDIDALGAEVTRVKRDFAERPIIAYLDGRNWPTTKPSWLRDRVWPSIQCYRMPNEPLVSFVSVMDDVLKCVSGYGVPMVLTPRFDDMNGQGSIAQTIEAMPHYERWLHEYLIVGFMPFSDRRGTGIAKAPLLHQWANAFLQANPARPNRYDYWIPSTGMATGLRNKLKQETSLLALLPEEKAYLLALLP